MGGYTLGLDIGSNSVGSAAVNKEKHLIKMGVSVFPAGIEESDTKRGAPKNQARRGFRSQRRITRRRAERKHQMRSFLLENGWIPDDTDREKRWLKDNNPWLLRRKGLKRGLKPDEFGRVLLHLAQRRGAYGFGVDEEDNDAGKIKDAISHTRKAMKECDAKTFGELIAIEFEKRRVQVGNKGKSIGQRVRNRRNAAGEDVYEFCADRDLIWEEFDKLWKQQKSFGGELAKQLTDDCRRELDNPEGDATWRYKGILFGQRKTYWDVGTMARCDLEPTDMKCPKVDMYAQEFLVLETVNNVRITQRGHSNRPLTPEEREKVITVLEKQKTATEATIRKALGIDKAEKRAAYTLNLEKDPKRGLNTNWFKREVVGAIGKDKWANTPEKEAESVNRAILKFDPQEKNDLEQLRTGCRDWWRFSEEQTKRFIEAWSKRSKLDDRVNYSRKAIKNLLPYMREGLTVNEARNRFAEDAENGASDAQRQRYSFGTRAGNKRLRQYLEKHPDLLPPAPEDISNPVVRKAIHEVRRHILAYIRQFGCKPERVVVELAREARQSARVRNKKLKENREREKERKEVINKFNLEKETKTQQKKAVDRVLLCREQKFRCAYCGDEKDTISEARAAKGDGVEMDHVIPESRGGNSYLSNLVLCHTKCNRGKGNKTPIEWLTTEEFNRLEQRLKHLEKSIKWDNLHKEVPDLDGFVESQLTDAAYAAKQVTGWLEKTLYGDKNDGKRHVFTTKGRYTAILRRDWCLFPDRKDGEQEGKKNRGDHRHHAIDAVITALSGPERLSELAHAAEKQELAKSEGFSYPEREPINPPWGDSDSFRKDVMKEYNTLVVTHRPEGRKITGALHNDTLYGPVLDKNGN
ncbi:MAG: type II CRISPR RNA-guided endonuclease Cas9, partial [Phycisphaerae bacterium]